MNKLFIFLLMLFSIPTFAQHLTFMGIPIDGTKESFYYRLESKGFTKTGFYMSGEFAGRTCRVFCIGEPIYQVDVDYLTYKGYVTVLPEGGSIISVISAIDQATQEYKKLNQVFQKKYGYADSVEDTRKETSYNALLGRYEVITRYDTTNGEIFVTLSINLGSSIWKTEPKGAISITYRDKENYPYSTIQDIYNDI